MKTKHLLTAIALPAIFAACTNEELPVENIVKENLDNRPLVENVTLSFGDAQSRATLQNYNKITFAEGDKLGVALVDNWSDDENDPILNYTLLENSINTNYIFTSDANGNFTSEAAMVEGNYVFYYPYNTQRSRQQILTNLPKEQTLTKMADGNYTSYPSVLAYSEEKGAPIAIAYDFLSTEDAGNALEGTLKQIYATPLITLTNVATEEVDGEDVPTSLTIKEIVLGKTSGTFTLSAPLNFADNAGTAYDEATGTAGSIVSALFDEVIPTGNGAKQGPWVKSILGRKTSSILGDAVDGGTSSSIVLKLEKPVTIPAEGTFSFYAVIPAEDYNTDKLTVTVYNEDGYAEDETLTAVSLTAGQRYPEGEFDANGIVNSDAKGLTMTVGIGDGFDTTGKLVSTVEEMITAIKKAEDGETLSLRIGGAAVINSRVASLLALATSTKADDIEIVNEVAFDGASVTWNPAVPVTFEAGVTVNEGAVVDLKGGESTFENGIENKGTLNVYSVYSLEAINNKGTLNLMGNLNAATLEVANTSEVNVKAWGTNNANANVTVQAIENGNDKKVAATINVDAAANLTAAVVNQAGATINNEGTISEVENHGTVNNGSEENVEATITSVTSNETTEDGYTAVINNYGKLAAADNDSEINMLSVNAVATVTGEGTVTNNVLAKVTNSADNKVTYTVTGAVKSSDISAQNLITNSISTLILSDATITVSANWAMTYDSKVLDWIVSGKTSINSGTGASAGHKISVDGSTALNIEILENSKLTINSGVDFDVDANIDSSADGASYVNNN